MLCYLIKYLVLFMTVVHTYFYIEVPVIVQAVTLTLFYRAL